MVRVIPLSPMALACVLLVGGGLLSPQPAQARPQGRHVSGSDVPLADAITSLHIPGGVEALARVAGVDAQQPRSRFMLTLIRVLYQWPPGVDSRADASRQRVIDYLGALARTPSREAGTGASSGSDADTVPMPIPASLMAALDRGRSSGTSDPVARLLGDRDAALLYYGFAALDAPTRQFLAGHQDLVRAMCSRTVSGVFALYGRSIRISAGRVVTPGGESVEAAWEQLAGASPRSPAAFVTALLRRDEGRLAYFYDTVAHMAAGPQAFVLAAGIADPHRRRVAIRDAYDATSPAMAAWNPIARPFDRPVFDCAHLFSALAVEPSGRLVPPASPSFWRNVWSDAALDRSPASVALSAAEPDLDAPALLKLVGVSLSDERRNRARLFLFAQRVFSRARGADYPDMFVTLRDFIRLESLDLALERMGITSPAVYAAATRRARILLDIGDRGKARAALGQYQGAMALVERARINRTIDAATAGRLVVSVSRIELQRDEYRGAIGTWIVGAFLPSAAPVRVPVGYQRLDRPIEDQVLAAQSGCGGQASSAADPVPSLTWEGLDYRVDPAHAHFVRAVSVRARQGGSSLDEALASRDADRRLGDVLMALAYAPSLGESQGPTLLGGDPSRLHDFGLDVPARSVFAQRAFVAPSETRDPARGWHVAGSVFGLDAALPYLGLRRVASEALAIAPTAREPDRRGLAEAAVLMNPFDQTDQARASVLAAMARGRQTRAVLIASDAGLDRLARLAGLDEWRTQTLPWVVSNEPSRLDDVMSLVEVARVGLDGAEAPSDWDQFGTSTAALNGRLGVSFPATGSWTLLAGRRSTTLVSSLVADLSLGLMEKLAAMGLPSSLTPGVAAAATQDVLDRLRPDFDDDWMSMVRQARQVVSQGIDDYVAALTTGGPLVPVGRERPDGSR